MNILIITPFYKQDRNIASVRWTNTAQRLAKKHNIIIVTQPLDNDMDMTFSKTTEDGILVARMNQKTTYEKIAVKYYHGATGDDWQTTATDKTSGNPNAKQKESFKRILKNRVLYASMKAKAKAYACEIKTKVIPQDMKIDVVISSACPFIEMLFGYELKKLLGCKWVSDFRDLPFIEDKCDDTHRMKKIMVKVLEKADGVFVVAPGMDNYLIDEEIVSDKDKVHVITNGFSKNDRRTTINIQDNKLHFCYTGSLYGGRRDPSLFFKSLSIVQQEIPEAEFVVDYAGGNGSTLLDSAKKYGMQNSVIDHGFLSREEALTIQGETDCLLSIDFSNAVCTFNGKIYEYMLQQKPIIEIVCGEYQNVQISAFIHKLKLGISVEEAKGEDDFERLTDYIKMQYKNKSSGKSIYFEPDEKAIQRFDHDSIVESIEVICSSLLR